RLGEEVRKLGQDAIWVVGQTELRSGESPAGVSLQDAHALRALPGVRAVTVVSETRRQTRSDFYNARTGIIGAEEAYASILGDRLQSGRDFPSQDMHSNARVCLIGPTLARDLFGPLDPVGRSIRIERHAYEVIGLLQSKGDRVGGVDPDDR